MPAIDLYREYALWFSSKAKYFLRAAKTNLDALKYAYAVTFAAEAIEFAGKSILEFMKENYSYDHVATGPLISLAAKHPSISTELTKLALSCGKWCDTVRDLSRYGGQTAKVSAPRIFDKKKYAEDAVAEAQEACSFLNRIETGMKMIRPIKIGILSGWVEADSNEKPCSEFMFTDRKFDWTGRIAEITDGSHQRFDIQSLDASKIDNTYALVINPFGEVYPEKDLKRRPVFEAIREYIADGGIFVNAAGWAFYYAWDVNEGKKQPAFLDRFYIPAELRLEPGKAAVKWQELFPLASSLLWSGFGCSTTYGPTGPQPVEITQTEEDKRVSGDLRETGSGNVVREFRSLTSKNCISFCRANRENFGEVYPIGAIRYGYGYLVVAGIEMDETGFEKVVTSIDNFCRWLKKEAAIDLSS